MPWQCRSGRQQFDCLVIGHFYGHLDEPARRLFLAEARRVSKSMLMIDAAQRDDVPPEEYQERVLNDGSRHVVYKRYFTPRTPDRRDRSRPDAARRPLVCRRAGLSHIDLSNS